MIVTGEPVVLNFEGLTVDVYTNGLAFTGVHGYVLWKVLVADGCEQVASCKWVFLLNVCLGLDCFGRGWANEVSCTPSSLGLALF